MTNTSQIDTGADEVLARREGHVAVISFNRPERRNALAPKTAHAIGRVLDAVREDPTVRVVMLTGVGGSFSAGGDVKSMNERNKGDAPVLSSKDRLDDLRERQRLVSLALHEFPKPVVAAIDGPAAGAGFSIAMACDLRIASPRAFIVTAFANVAGSGDFGGSWFLTRLLGESRAKALYFRSPRVSAQEALDMGLITEILDAGHDDENPEAAFADAALNWCYELSKRAPLAISKMKENINRATLVDLETALDAEALNMVTTMSTNDHKEAAAAFVEKRTPVFRGE